MEEELRCLTDLAHEVARESRELAHAARRTRHEVAALRREVASLRAEAATLRARIAHAWQQVRPDLVVLPGRRGSGIPSK